MSQFISPWYQNFQSLCWHVQEFHTLPFCFSGQALSDRVNDSNSKVVITADGGFRRGKLIELKKVVDEAIPFCSSIEHVIVLKRASNNIKMSSKYVWWHDIIEDALSYFEPEIVEYTSIVYSIHVWYDRQA